MGHSPEARQFLSVLIKYGPILLVPFLKGIYDHHLGKFMYSIIMMMQEQNRINFIY
jgi:hypothetical protein